ncbi:hypothetical protein QOZ80_2AG0133370 [Eleusine coracana subsp. coracana]|nr:hypothetical protein QOZ80_2AG0133370 [Eleusine coracana subsp. coracana]
MPLFFYCIDDDHVGVHLRAAASRSRSSASRTSTPRSPPWILLHSYDARLYACNPCTRLPRIDHHADIVGFYAHDLGGGREYRVLYRCYQLGLNNITCTFTYWILSLPESVRFIGRPTNLEAVDLLLAGGISPSFRQPLQFHQDNRYILVFDTVDEMFSWIRRPPVLEDNWLVQVEREQLLEINGRLAMIAGASTVVSVWVLQDYIGQVWACEYLIHLPVAAIQANLGYVVTRDYEEPGPYAAYALVFAVSQDRNVLVQCTHALLQCDAHGTLLQSADLTTSC